MYICVCKAISDRTIHRAIDDGACSVRALKDELGVATGCGRCVPEIRALLAQRASTSAVSITLADLVAST